MGKGEVKVNIAVDRSELDDALEKAKRLREVLQEAKSLASDLAAMKIDLMSEFEVES